MNAYIVKRFEFIDLSKEVGIMSLNRTAAGLRILLVEDDKHDRVAFGRAFKRSSLSCKITECERAEEALERLHGHTSSFDLVVVDHGLPGISGLDFCKELLDERLSLPLVILTGRGSEELAIEALKAGVDDYIIKDPGQGYLNLLPTVLPEVVRKHGDRLARRQAEEALQKAHDELEQRVEERTAKLAQTTEQLKLELAERRRVEESLRQSEEQLQRRAAELERSNQALEQFAYVASHDLQEPLRTVVTYLRLLERGYKGKLGGDADGFIAYAIDGANRMYDLIDRLLRGAAMGPGRKCFQPSDREFL